MNIFFSKPFSKHTKQSSPWVRPSPAPPVRTDGRAAAAPRAPSPRQQRHMCGPEGCSQPSRLPRLYLTDGAQDRRPTRAGTRSSGDTSWQAPTGPAQSGPGTRGLKAAGADVRAEKGLETSPTGAEGWGASLAPSSLRLYPLAPNHLKPHHEATPRRTGSRRKGLGAPGQPPPHPPAQIRPRGSRRWESSSTAGGGGVSSTPDVRKARPTRA